VGESEETGKLDTLEKVTRIASSLTVILGVVVVVMGIFSAVDEGSRAVKSMRLSSLPYIQELIRNDTAFRPKIAVFLESYDSEQLMVLLTQYETGSAAYYSGDLIHFREIGRHYDLMGALVKLDYIDFDLLYAVVPFPDDFWTETEAFREELRVRNWDTDGGLPDFWENFEFLGTLYDQAREADKKAREADRRKSRAATG
jgi:hypothetical protein